MRRQQHLRSARKQTLPGRRSPPSHSLALQELELETGPHSILPRPIRDTFMAQPVGNALAWRVRMVERRARMCTCRSSTCQARSSGSLFCSLLLDQIKERSEATILMCFNTSQGVCSTAPAACWPCHHVSAQAAGSVAAWPGSRHAFTGLARRGDRLRDVLFTAIRAASCCVMSGSDCSHPCPPRRVEIMN